MNDNMKSDNLRPVSKTNVAKWQKLSDLTDKIVRDALLKKLNNKPINANDNKH